MPSEEGLMISFPSPVASNAMRTRGRFEAKLGKIAKAKPSARAVKGEAAK